MSKGFAKVSHSRNGNVAYYLREGECMAFKHPCGYDKEAILQHWELIEKYEKLGNKDLGIRGRHDARVRTNYILSMPNTLSPSTCLERVQSIIDKTPIKDCVYTTVVHKGEKDGITNQHVHLLVNERILSTQKKDREMQRKEWLDKTFKCLYEKEFKVEFSEGQSVVPRERINQGLFEADRKLSRQGIKAHQGQMPSFDNSHKVLAAILLMVQLRAFENAFIAEQRRQVAETQAKAEAQRREDARLLEQEIMANLSLLLGKEQERKSQEIQIQQEQFLEKERIAEALKLEALKNQERKSQEIQIQQEQFLEKERIAEVLKLEEIKQERKSQEIQIQQEQILEKQRIAETLKLEEIKQERKSQEIQIQQEQILEKERIAEALKLEEIKQVRKSQEIQIQQEQILEKQRIAEALKLEEIKQARKAQESLSPAIKKEQEKEIPRRRMRF